MCRIRAASSLAPSLAVDNALITLPVKLGGLGILSLQTCAPRAFAAASEASDTLLAPLLGHDTDTANQTILSQRERCQEAFLASRDSLFEFLDPRSAKSVIEAASLFGRKALYGSATSRSRRRCTHGPYSRALRRTADTAGQ
jgi:hypothetical protein